MTQPYTTPKAFESMLAECIRDAVEEWAIDRVPDDDGSRADVVIIGKPTGELSQNIVISVRMQHPLGPRMDRDRAVSGRGVGGQSDRPYRFPLEFIGGTRVEEIIGCVEVRIRLDYEYSQATYLIAPVIQRVKDAINKDKSLDYFTDGMGNSMVKIETFQAIGYEAGGGDTSLNYRWVDFVAYVVSSNCRET